jgi:hypothetical protein
MSHEGTAAANGRNGNEVVVEEGSRAEALRDTLRNNQQGAAINSRREFILRSGKPNHDSVRTINSFLFSCHRSTMRDLRDATATAPKKGCCNRVSGIIDQFPLTFIIGGAIIGMCIGIGLAYWKPAAPADKATAIMWIGLLGELFIRALKCIVLPLVFVSIAVSVMDMVS